MGRKSQQLIESGFPFDQLSAIAEQESWRKEVNRPASYIHKWWARRLGSVFRGLIIGGFEKPEVDFSINIIAILHIRVKWFLILLWEAERLCMKRSNLVLKR